MRDPLEKHDLQEPVERDRDLAEEELAEHIRRDQQIVERPEATPRAPSTARTMFIRSGSEANRHFAS